MAAGSSHSNLLGPGQNFSDGTGSSGWDTMTAEHKWILLGLAGFVGGSLAYIVYRRRRRALLNGNSAATGIHGQRSKQQPNRSEIEQEFSCIRDLPTEVHTGI